MEEHASVCAALGPAPAAVEAALAAQQHPPDETIRTDAGLRSALERALATGCDWVWLLDGATAPRPDALQALLDGLRRAKGLPAPSLLAGVAVGADGQIDARRSLWYRRNQINITMGTVGRRLLPVRATAGPALVRSSAAAELVPGGRTPLSPAGVLRWTARILRGRVGYLVPEAESEIVDPARDPMGEPLTALRLLLGRSLVRFDRLTYGYELAERTFVRPVER